MNREVNELMQEIEKIISLDLEQYNKLEYLLLKFAADIYANGAEDLQTNRE